MSKLNSILLPKDNEFSKVVAKDAHIEARHMGLNYTIYALRNCFWVPRYHSLIYNTILNCQSCVLERRGQRSHVPECSPLPEWRFDTTNPWIRVTTFLRFLQDFPAKKKKAGIFGRNCGKLLIFSSMLPQSVLRKPQEGLSIEEGPRVFFHNVLGSKFKGFSEELKKVF